MFPHFLKQRAFFFDRKNSTDINALQRSLKLFENSNLIFFRTFQVENESANYRLHVGGFSGTAGDSFTSDHSHHLMMFTTRDRDNDNRLCLH